MNRSIRVLVADDEKNLRDLVVRELCRRGLEVEGVGDGEAALEPAARDSVRRGGARHEDAEEGRHRGAARAAGVPRASASDRHDRVPGSVHRRRGDEARRLRLPDQADQDRGARHSRAQGGGEGPAPARQPGSPRPRPRRRALRGHRHPQPADARGPAHRRAGGADRLLRAGARRERHRQGAGGARDPRALAPRASDRSCRSTAARSPRGAGVRAVRPREGRVHRRRRRQARPHRAGRRRHALPRRDRRHGARQPGEAAARAGDGHVLPRRRHPAPARRRPAGRGHQSRPGRWR